MMYEIKASGRYKKDYKRIVSRGLDTSELDHVIDLLADGQTLDAKYCDHQLSGQYNEFRECHIEPDWLLMYKYNNDELILRLIRTGSHSDLFE